MGSKRKTKKTRYNKKQQEYEDNLFGSDETFAFIAGYTAGGFPYGITWEEMGEIEQKDTNHILDNEAFELPFD